MQAADGIKPQAITTAFWAAVCTTHPLMSPALCSDMDELLTSVSPELVDEFADDFFANRGRKVLHDSKRWRVLDTWIGNPAEHFRYPACCSLQSFSAMKVLTPCRSS